MIACLLGTNSSCTDVAVAVAVAAAAVAAAAAAAVADGLWRVLHGHGTLSSCRWFQCWSGSEPEQSKIEFVAPNGSFEIGPRGRAWAAWGSRCIVP